MGKASRKMAKNKEKQEKGKLVKDVQALRAKMQEQMEAEEYADALETLSGLIQDKCYDAELMYQGAYCYFMVGDYKRATEWVSNTLNYAPQHVAARILLARICILEDRTEAGLAIFDFVLENYGQGLSDEQQEEISDVLEYYGRNEPDTIREKFPAVAAFLGLKTESMDVPSKEAAAAAVPELEPETESKPVEATKIQQDVSAEDELETTRQSILAKTISLGEKVRLFNSFAGAYFYQRKLAEAKYLLDEALAIDAADEETLRNMALLLHDMGKQEEALQFAGRIQQADFALLAALR